MAATGSRYQRGSSAPSVTTVTCDSSLPTHPFGGDVGVREAPVLTHDGQVAVDVYGQRVAGHHHDAAETKRTFFFCRLITWYLDEVT